MVYATVKLTILDVLVLFDGLKRITIDLPSSKAEVVGVHLKVYLNILI